MLKERRQHSLYCKSSATKMQLKEEQITLSQKQGFLSRRSQPVSFRVPHSGGCAELKGSGTRAYLCNHSDTTAVPGADMGSTQPKFQVSGRIKVIVSYIENSKLIIVSHRQTKHRTRKKPNENPL